MTIHVRYYGQAREIAGVEQESLELETPASVRQAVGVAIARHAGLADLLLAPDGALRKSVLVPVNDEVVDVLAEDAITGGDDVSIFPAVSGG